MTTLTGSAIRAFQIRCQMAAIKLEEKGFTRKGSRPLTPILKKFYGLPCSATYADVLASLQDDLDAMDEQALREAKPSDSALDSAH